MIKKIARNIQFLAFLYFQNIFLLTTISFNFFQIQIIIILSIAVNISIALYVYLLNILNQEHPHPT